MKKRLLAILTVLCLTFTSLTAVSFGATATWTSAFSKTETYLTASFKNPTVGSEWTIIGLARSGAAVTDATYNKYYSNLAAELKANDGVLSERKYSEYSRAILGLTAIGKDPADVGGYNLLAKLADFDKVKYQGSNGPIWALIALDSGAYEIPTVTGVTDLTTRDKLIDFILDAELEGGGFALTGTEPDSDMTAMALTALAPYKDRSDVKAFVDRALAVLSEKQNSDGTYSTVGTKTAESTSQVIVALTSLGIDPATDARFIKNGKTAIDGLLKFYASSKGAFRHVLKDTSGNTGKIDAMATEQGYYALTAYSRFKNGKTSLYNMTDGKGISKPVKTAITSLKSAKTKTMTVKVKKVSGAKGYQIKYATNSKFTGSKTVTTTALTRTIKSLKKGKTYYVKVRAYKTDENGKKIYGSYCTVKKVKIK